MTVAPSPVNSKPFTAEDINVLYHEGIRELQAVKLLPTGYRNAQLVLLMICRAMQPHSDGDVHARISMRTIVEQTNMSVATVHRHVGLLVELGIIERSTARYRDIVASTYVLASKPHVLLSNRMKSTPFTKEESPFPRNTFRYQTQSSCFTDGDLAGQGPIKTLSDPRHNAWVGHRAAYSLYLASLDAWGGTVLLKDLAAQARVGLRLALRELRYLKTITGWTTRRVGRSMTDLLINTGAGQALDENHVRAEHHSGRDYLGERLARVKAERECHRRWLAQGALTKMQRIALQNPMIKALNDFWWRQIRGEITMTQLQHAWSQTIAGVLVVIP